MFSSHSGIGGIIRFRASAANAAARVTRQTSSVAPHQCNLPKLLLSRATPGSVSAFLLLAAEAKTSRGMNITG